MCTGKHLEKLQETVRDLKTLRKITFSDRPCASLGSDARMLDWRWQKSFSLNLCLYSLASVTSAHSFRLGIHMRVLPQAPDVELALLHEAQAPGLPEIGAQ